VQKTSQDAIIEFLPRVFGRSYLHSSAVPQPMLDELPMLLGPGGGAGNTFLVLAPEGRGARPFVHATTVLPHAHLAGVGRRTVVLPRNTFDPKGNVRDNISAWAVERFREVYGTLPVRHDHDPATIPPSLSEVRAARAQGIRRRQLRKATTDRSITSADVLNYTYAVINDPSWSIRTDEGATSPGPVRITLHPDLEAWCTMGQELLELHLGHEMLEAWPLTATPLPAPLFDRIVHTDEDAAHIWRLRLRTDKAEGWIDIDGRIRLDGVPARAWDVMMGERAMLDRVTDHYKEMVLHPGRSVKEERLARERHIDRFVRTLRRVCRLCLETQRIQRVIGSLPHANPTRRSM
jgi:predicted helicase